MRILWHSNAPWTPSGYGQQTGLFAYRLQALGHQLGIVCFYGLEGGILNMNGIPCYPKGAHPYGLDVIVPHYQAHQADVFMTLMDSWVLNPEDWTPAVRWVPWYPVDHDPMPMIIRNKLGLAYRRIAMSKFGVEKTHEAGLDCEYIPHGIDTRLFHPGSKAEARLKLNWPADRWIVSTVAMNKGNPSRKNLAELARAFALFHAKHPDAWYWLQTAPGAGVPDMVNMPELMLNLGLQEGKDYGIANPFQVAIGYPPDYIAELYRASDVMMLVSKGEGFGIPVLEAQACECPVITAGWTASRELCMAGRMVEKEDCHEEWSGLASNQYIPNPAAITALLEEEYAHPTDTTGLAERVRLEYDADIVTATKWKPILAKIEGGLK